MKEVKKNNLSYLNLFYVKWFKIFKSILLFNEVLINIKYRFCLNLYSICQTTKKLLTQQILTELNIRFS